MEKKHLDHLAKESAERKELEDAQNHQDAVYHAQKKNWKSIEQSHPLLN